jgi:NAD-dependent dihydropyrimidine dehydrogenase PreA subunit
MQRKHLNLLLAAVLVVSVVMLSIVFTGLWGGKTEKSAAPGQVVFRSDMSIGAFGRENSLSIATLRQIFGTLEPRDLGRKLDDTGIPESELIARARKAMAMNAEFGTKNWIKIPIKLGLWLVMVVIAFLLMRRGAVTATRRKWMYLAAVAVFGVILGNEPSPMNTLTDTVALFGQKGIIFPPRAAVLTVFLVIVVLANKFICAWGCQFGTLQDLLFRLNRDSDERGILKQYKLPFVATNAVRASVFILFMVLALAWAIDIIAPVNPFKIYLPAAVTAAGAGMLGLLLLSSFVVYRPWCHLFCPFGFVGWLLEQASVFKVQVNYDTCIACKQCTTACPSAVMGRILERTGTIPDCFSCGTCMNVCPTRSISFRSGTRARPPKGKFTNKGGAQ